MLIAAGTMLFIVDKNIQNNNFDSTISRQAKVIKKK